MSAAVDQLPEQAFVYVIGAKDGPQKIGIAIDPQSRLRLFQTGNPAQIEVSAAIPVSRAESAEVERRAHFLLAGHHAMGEWFSVTPQMARAAVLEAAEAVRSGAASVPRIAGVGRKKLWPERMDAMLPKGTFERMDAVRLEDETRTDLIREAVERELARREAEAKKERKGKKG